jgi:hypothetical protein
MVRAVLCAGLITCTAHALDGGFQALAPTGFLWGFPASPSIAPGALEQLRRETTELGLRNYVPLTGNNASLWLEIPLPLATRFLYQFPWLFRPTDTRRRAELLRDVTATDLVVVNSRRPLLDPTIEREITSVLNGGFKVAFTTQWLEFWVHRGPSPHRTTGDLVIGRVP